MFSLRISVLATLGLAALSASAATSHFEPRVPMRCYSGPFMIVAHGTNQEGEGGLQNITERVMHHIPSAGSTGFKYPAEIYHYPDSESKGLLKMKKFIRKYIKKCGKNASVMLLGYSQGAQIVSDVMGGGTYKKVKGHAAHPLKDRYKKHIIAVLQFGDPAFMAGHPWDSGTSHRNGKYPRTKKQLQHIKQYKSKLRSFCDEGDPFCARGNEPSVHGTYINRYGDTAVKWLVKKWHKSRP